jgi:hypothetical protein
VRPGRYRALVAREVEALRRLAGLGSARKPTRARSAGRRRR